MKDSMVLQTLNLSPHQREREMLNCTLFNLLLQNPQNCSITALMVAAQHCCNALTSAFVQQWVCVYAGVVFWVAIHI